MGALTRVRVGPLCMGALTLVAVGPLCMGVLTLAPRVVARIVHNDFSAAFDRVSLQWILYKLCSAGFGGSLLPVLTQFFSDRSQVDGCLSNLVNVVLGLLLLLLYT